MSAQPVLDLSLEALALLGVTEVETEVSIMEAPIYIEAADRGEVVPVDIRDPAGGFGGIDLWIATLIPVLAKAIELRRAGDLNVGALDRVVDEIVPKVRSPRAAQEKDALRRALHRVLRLSDEPGR